MISLRILLSLAILYLGVFSTGCAPDRQEPKPQEGAAGQAEPAAENEGLISDQDFETGMGQWEVAGTDSDASSEEGEEDKPPTP